MATLNLRDGVEMHDTTEIDVREQNGGHTIDAACDADYHQHCACPKTCRCKCHHPARQRAERAEAMGRLRGEVKESRHSYRSIASSCGKSASWIGEVFRGNYPYYGACQLPKYLRVWLQDNGFRAEDNLITF